MISFEICRNCSMIARRVIGLVLLLIIFLQVSCRGAEPESNAETTQTPDNEAYYDQENAAAFFKLGQELGNYQSWDIDLEDLNQDGYLDLFVASLEDDDPKIWFNNGSSEFSPGDHQLPGCSRAVIGDINLDGRMDIILAEWDSSAPVWTNLLTVYLGGEDGSFNRGDQLKVGEETQTMLLQDLNADQAPDLFVLGRGQNLVWLNDGMGNLDPTDQDLTTGLDAAAAAGDFDGDGDLDILSGGWDGPPGLWLNDGAGYFTRIGISITGEELHIHGMAVDDVDGDGDLDAFVTLANRDPHQVWLNDGKGEFSLSQSLPAPLGHAVALGDVDGDGDVDAVTGHGFGSHGGVRVWINDGEGYFSEISWVLGDKFSAAIALGDLDQDGDLDLISAQNEWDADVGPPDLIWINQSQLQDLEASD